MNRAMHISTTVRCHFSLRKLAKMEKMVISRIEENKEKQVLYNLLVRDTHIGITFQAAREQKT